MFFNDVDGGIIVDTELMDAFTEDGAALANDHVSGQFFRIAPGRNVVSWQAEDGSSVSSVSILPRWRSM
jgi:phage-related protein